MRRQAHSVDLTAGTIWKTLFLYSLPILASSLFQQLYTTVDAVIVGQFAGKTGLAAIDSIYSLLKLPVNFFVGLSTGAAIIISQYYGAKKDEWLSKAVHTSICFALVGGSLLSCLGVFASPYCMDLLKVPEEISGQALGYVRIYFGGLAVSLLYNIIAGILRAVGDSKTPFYALVAAGLANIILDLIFVGVFRMNAAGAALATVLAQGVSMALVLRAIVKVNAPYRVRLSRLKWDASIIRSVFRLGLPIGFQALFYPIANMMIQSSINGAGTDNIAAWALCGKLDFMLWLVADAMAATTSTFVAQNYGAKQYSRAREGVRVSLAMTLALVIAISVVLYLWCEPLGRLFINKADMDIVPLAGGLMRFLAPFYSLYVFGEIYSAGIRGTGESFKPMLVTLFGTCATRILWILLVIPRNDSMLVILSCYPLSWAMTSIMFAVYYHAKQIKVFPLRRQNRTER